jgi:hypothetical protein
LLFSEERLRRFLAKYATYYNEVRTHVSLGKDAPCTRAIERLDFACPILGGLHARMRQSRDEGQWAKRIFEGAPQSRPFIQIIFLVRIPRCKNVIDAAFVD